MSKNSFFGIFFFSLFCFFFFTFCFSSLFFFFFHLFFLCIFLLFFLSTFFCSFFSFWIKWIQKYLHEWLLMGRSKTLAWKHEWDYCGRGVVSCDAWGNLARMNCLVSWSEFTCSWVFFISTWNCCLLPAIVVIFVPLCCWWKCLGGPLIQL